jgi:hypothetical protein
MLVQFRKTVFRLKKINSAKKEYSSSSIIIIIFCIFEVLLDFKGDYSQFGEQK